MKAESRHLIEAHGIVLLLQAEGLAVEQYQAKDVIAEALADFETRLCGRIPSVKVEPQGAPQKPEGARMNLGAPCELCAGRGCPSCSDTGQATISEPREAPTDAQRMGAIFARDWNKAR